MNPFAKNESSFNNEHIWKPSNRSFRRKKDYMNNKKQEAITEAKKSTVSMKNHQTSN